MPLTSCTAFCLLQELDVPYLKLAATEIVSGVSGESEENIRDVFEQAQVGGCPLGMGIVVTPLVQFPFVY